MSNCNSVPRLSLGGSKSSGGCNPNGVTGTIGCNNNNSAIDNCDGVGDRKSRERVRLQLHDYILLKLGAPVIEVELDSQGIDLIISEAMDIYSNWAPLELWDFLTIRTTPGKSVYELPDQVGLVRDISYQEQPDFPFGGTELGGQIPLEYLYGGNGFGGAVNPVAPIWGSTGEFTLFKQYLQNFNKISSRIGGYQLLNNGKHIKIYPVPCGTCSTIIVHFLQACKNFEQPYQALREGCYALAEIMVGEIRSKYTNIPSAGAGGVVLNGESIMARGREDLAKWEEKLMNKFSDLLFITTG